MSNAKIMQHNKELPAHCDLPVPELQFPLAGRQGQRKAGVKPFSGSTSAQRQHVHGILTNEEI